MRKLASVLRLTRIEHSVMLVIAVVAAEILSGGLPSLPVLLLSLITPIFLSMSAFAVNDYFDVRVDAANGRRRPLVTGELKPADAVYITIITMALGMLGSLFLNIYCLAIALIFGSLSILYSYRLKAVPLVGNAYVAFSMAIPFIFGNYVVSRNLLVQTSLIFVLIFLSGLAREIDGTVRDFDGDAKRKARTLPRVIGIENSAYLAFALYIVAIAITLYMFLDVEPFAGNLVFGSLMLTSDVMVFYSGLIYVLLDSRNYDKVRNISLGGMGLALVCILISSLVYI
jgi:geranylgeranylglycerol-phosphate geranylgeranyltransferase